MRVLLSPHNDDESLFAAYTIMREKPLVIIVTDSNRQEGVTAQERREETMRACEILGVPVEFLGLEDGSLGELDLTRELQSLNTRLWEYVYAPAIQGGHNDHDVVGRIASKLFPSTRYYSTYTKDNYDPFGQHSIVPTAVEIDIKNDALACYKSQLKIEGVRLNHFEMVRGKSEYLNDTPHSWQASGT